MALATLTNKGQVTIPKVVRESLGLHSGDKLDFVIAENRKAYIMPVTMKVDDVFGRLHKPGRKPVFVEKIDEKISDISCRFFYLAFFLLPFLRSNLTSATLIDIAILFAYQITICK